MLYVCVHYAMHRRLWRVRAGTGPGHEPRVGAGKRPGSELGLGAGRGLSRESGRYWAGGQGRDGAVA